ncbi:hypothetical protein [Dokdonella sp.]|uniref:hypothetical protein n=1 Tax=Dokdonella sp. TaxID=2291710 RepID=UPI001B07D04C|nr:hypothetical protein [Dokdonella sp.]MBO9662086.1 hypothetical protein [Dokdonella sp.]
MPENLWSYLLVAAVFFVLGRVTADRGGARPGIGAGDRNERARTPRPTTPPRPLELPTDLDTEIREMIVHGNPIQAIKRYREATGVDLKTAKEAIDDYQERLRRSGLL